mgnify:CR=1 FL=1
MFCIYIQFRRSEIFYFVKHKNKTSKLSNLILHQFGGLYKNSFSTVLFDSVSVFICQKQNRQKRNRLRCKKRDPDSI